MESLAGALHLVVASDEALLRRLAEEGRLGTPPPRSLAACVAAILVDEEAAARAKARAAIAAARVTAREAHLARHAGRSASGLLIRDDDPWVARLTRAIAWAPAVHEAGDASEDGPAGAHQPRPARQHLKSRMRKDSFRK